MRLLASLKDAELVVADEGSETLAVSRARVIVLLGILAMPIIAQGDSCGQLEKEFNAAAAAYVDCINKHPNHTELCDAQQRTWLELGNEFFSQCKISHHWILSEMQPDIQQGGRANTIAVDPTNDKNILVTSESGGMFHSFDGGNTWVHVDSLAAFELMAVAFVPADPNIVIATASADFRSYNGGAIWRSTDGGILWVPIDNPPAPPGVTDRMSASEISVAADTGTIYVATNYGVLLSANRGVSWNLVQPFTNGDPVNSVLAQIGGHILAGSAGGISRSVDGGAHWITPTVNTGGIGDFHAFAASPFSVEQAYVVDGDTALYYTEDAGDHWTMIASAPQGRGSCGGIAFAKTVGFPSFGPRARDVLNIYYSNGCNTYKLVAERVGTGNASFDYSGTWAELNVDHGDTRDLAFGKYKNPLLLATDGGLHNTKDGLNWSFVGGGRNGYNALQIYETQGQWIETPSPGDPPRHDIYFGTQDNNIWASNDTGVTWPISLCCEGFSIELLYRVPTPDNDQVTFTTCGGCTDFLSGALFSNKVNWPDPPKNFKGPKIIAKSFHVEPVKDSESFSNGLVVTTDLGTSWYQYVAISDDMEELPKLSWYFGRIGSPFRQPTPVLYQAIQYIWDDSRNVPIMHLARITGKSFVLGHPSATVTYPAMNDFGSLGVNPTNIDWYQVFAVDPGNANHVIAPDIVNNLIEQTFDGGENWKFMTQLTSLVTNNGGFQFKKQENQPFVSAISFDPDDANMVALGTWENGVFISSDNGSTWIKVPNSERIPHITGFDWRTPEDLIISSYGRGLWRATLQQSGQPFLSSERSKGIVSPSRSLRQETDQDLESGEKRSRSPMEGKPKLLLRTHNRAGDRIATPGQVIELIGQNFKHTGAVAVLTLDGRLVEKVSIGPDGTFHTSLVAPMKAGLHKVTARETTTSKNIAGVMFIVRGEDFPERAAHK